MSISGSRWSLKNSVINSEWLNALFIHTDELVPNVFAIKVRQYQIRNRLTQRTSDQRRRPGVITLPRQKSLLIIFRHLFSVRYIGTFPRSVNNWHHITLFEVHVYLPFPLGPVGFTNQLVDFYFRIQRHIFLHYQYSITHNELNMEYSNVHDVRLFQLQ